MVALLSINEHRLAIQELSISYVRRWNNEHGDHRRSKALLRLYIFIIDPLVWGFSQRGAHEAYQQMQKV